MDSKNKHTVVNLIAICLFGALGCSKDPASNLYGTWKGTTKIDQTMTITLRPDSTIDIETDGEDLRLVRKGRFQIVDRRLRITLTTSETYSGSNVKREKKVDQDEAVVTMTSKDEMVLRKGTQAIILQRITDPG